MNNDFEKNKSRLDDQSFIDNFREDFANQLDDIATDPKVHKAIAPNVESGNKIRKGKKLDKNDNTIRGVLFVLDMIKD